MKNIFHVENLLKQQQPFIMVGLSISASQPQDLPIDLRLNRSDNKQSIEQIQPIEKVARLRRENNGESASLAKQVVDCGQGLERAQSSRSRTLFSDWQLACLEWRFTRNKYLTSSDRRKVAELLHLRQVQVKTWFQVSFANTIIFTRSSYGPYSHLDRKFKFTG